MRQQLKRGQFARPALCGLTFLIACSTATLVTGITRRHDTLDEEYIDLAADPAFAAFGMFRAPGTCNWSGGTLIHPEWVITAAHCTPGPMTTGVQFSLGPATGSFDLTVAAESWFRNTDFNNPATGDDFGLVHLAEPVLDVTPARRYRQAGERTNTATVLGYGYTGTGITGQTGDGLGTRRASQNVVDFFGALYGWSSTIMLTDFDNPDNPADSQFGSSTPLATEGAVALYDSGGAWFMNLDGIEYLVGVTSFRADIDDANDADSDYKDISAAGRVSRAAGWIDTNSDITLFWKDGTGAWEQSNMWDASAVPGAAQAAVISTGDVAVTQGGAEAEYVFLEGNGRLTLGNDLTVGNFMQRQQSSLQVDGVQTLAGDYRQQGGTLAIDLAGTSPGAADRLVVDGPATIDSILAINNSGTYTDPDARGDQDVFTVLAATSIDGTFASVTYNGQSLETGQQYVGTTQSGIDGLFRTLAYSGTEVTVTNYLALPGDANGDGSVDVSDFNIWNSHKFSGGTDWTSADFDGDGFTDVTDFNIWNSHKFQNAVAAAPALVPEPSAAAAMLITLLYWLGLTRRTVRQ